MSAPFVVAKVCEAEELVQQATARLMEARLDVARIDADVSPQARAAQAGLSALAARLQEVLADLGPAVRETAALIRDPEGGG